MKLRWHWGTGISAVYAAFALGTSGMVALAMHEHVDLVSDDYYDQAVKLDARRMAEARAAALGNGFAIAPEPASERVVVQWPREMSVESGTLTLYRPSDAGKDRTIPTSLDADHRQIVSLTGLTPGRGLLQARWQSRGEAYYAEREVTVAAAR
jgi:hypothetical protein